MQVLGRMNRHELARLVFDQTTRDWDFHMEFKRGALRCGLEGQDLINRLKLLPERWKAQLADGRPVPVASWRPPQWEEFLDPELIEWLDEHDRTSAEYYGRPYTPATPAAALPVSGGGQVLQDDNHVPAAVAPIDVEHSFEDFDSYSASNTLESEDAEDDATVAPPAAPAGLEEHVGAGARAGPAGRGARAARGRPRGGLFGPGAPGRARRRTRGGAPLCASAVSSGMGDDDEARDDKDRGAEQLQAPATGSPVPVPAPDWNAVWKSPAPDSGAQDRAWGTAGSGGRVPDWLVDGEARQAIADGTARLERDGSGWYLRRLGAEGRGQLVPGQDLDQALLELEESRMLGDQEAWRYLGARPLTQRPVRGMRLGQNVHATLALNEWKSVRLETRLVDGQDHSDLLLHDDEFWLEPDEYDAAVMEQLGASEVQDSSAGQDALASLEGQQPAPAKPQLDVESALYSAEDVRKRQSYFKSLDEWMEAKRGRAVKDAVDGLKKVPVNRSLSADDEEEVVRDLRDGVFGKSIYSSDLRVWAVDDRDAGRATDASDLSQLCTVAQAYGWVQQEELLRRASLRTYSLDDYQSFRFEPALSADHAPVVLQALKSAHMRFAYAAATDHRPGLLLVLHRLCPTARQVLEQVLERQLPGHTVHEGEYHALIPMDEIPIAVHNRLCSFDYGDVQYWQAALAPASLPPLGNLLAAQDQHAWLVPSKFTAWLREDLTEHGWRPIQEAAEALQHNKVVVTGEWLSLRFLAGKPAPEVHQELVSGRFGSVVRLGDLMARPTALDYDLSMFMKDVYMIPKEQQQAVLEWCEPEALDRMQQEEQMRAEVQALKAAAEARAHAAPADDDDDDDALFPAEDLLEALQTPQARLETPTVPVPMPKLATTGREEEVERDDQGAVPLDEQGVLRMDQEDMKRDDQVAVPRDDQGAMQMETAEQTRQPTRRPPKDDGTANMDRDDETANVDQDDATANTDPAPPAGAPGDDSVEEEPYAAKQAMEPAVLDGAQEQANTGRQLMEGALGGRESASAGVGSGAGLGALRYAVQKLHPSWRQQLDGEFTSDYFVGIAKYLRTEIKLLGNQIYPSPDLIFNALDSTPFDQVKVVIIGQDPYHGENQAHGLAFSVPPGISAPPSLQNIFKELRDDPDIDFKPPPGRGGDLTSWAKQGVLLLNTVLTVRAGDPLSHRNFGWEEFTDAAIRRLNDGRTNLIFVLWGANAQKKADLITGETHTVLMSSHPSPLSATKGRTPFSGSRHFSLINRVLREQGTAEIDWSLADETR